MAANEPGRAAITVYLTPDQLAEIDELATGLKISRTDWFRRLLTEWLLAKRAPGQDNKPDRRAKRVRFLDQLASLFHISRAAKAAGLTAREAKAWMAEDADFRASVEEAQETAVDDIEAKIMQCASGNLELSKAAVTAAIAFLNAHHYAWGRVKVELLNRIVNPLFDLFLKILGEELGPGGQATLEKVAVKFAREKELRVASFSE